MLIVKFFVTSLPWSYLVNEGDTVDRVITDLSWLWGSVSIKSYGAKTEASPFLEAKATYRCC